MPGQTTTVTVSGTASGLLNGTLTGGATAHAVLSDNSDASYIENNGTTAGFVAVNVATPSAIPSNSTIESMMITLRRGSNGPTANGWYVREVYGFDKNSVGPFFHNKVGGWTLEPLHDDTGGIGNNKSVTVDRMADGTIIELMNTSTLVIVLVTDAEAVGSTNRLYEVDVTFTYYTPPVVTVTGPVSPATTSRPTITWTNTDAESDPQEAYQVRVFDLGNPNWSYDSGKVYSPALSLWLPVGLTNGNTYRADVRTWGPAVLGEPQESFYASRTFTVAVTPPLAPSTAFTVDNSQAGVHIVVDEGSRATPHPVSYDVEKSIDSGATWSTVRGGSRGGTSVGVWHTGATAAGINVTAAASGIAAGAISDGFTIRWHGALSDYTPAAAQSMFSWTATSPDIGLDFSIGTTGLLLLRWSSAGASFDGSATATAATGVADGTEIWFEAKLNALSNPWRVDFRKSTDGVNWTAIGSQVVGASAIHPRQSAGNLNIGGQNNLFFDPMIGYTYSAEFYDENGTLLTNPNFVGQTITTGTSTPFTDSKGVTWVLAGTAYAQVRLDLWEREAVLGVPATYRARAWRNDTENSAGPYTTSGSLTISNASWWLKDPIVPALNMAVQVIGIKRTRPRPQTISDGLDAELASVTHAGLRGNQGTVTIRANNLAQYNALQAIARAGRTLLLQSVLKEQFYVQLGSVDLDLVKAAPDLGEGTPIKHLHEIPIDFVEVVGP